MIHKLIASIFILFAVFQYNDGDAYLWIPIYLLVALLILLYDVKKIKASIFGISAIFYLIGMLLYTPDVISWIEGGTPSITGSMQAESPFIEFIREFFGLFICFVTLLSYALISARYYKTKSSV